MQPHASALVSLAIPALTLLVLTALIPMLARTAGHRAALGFGVVGALWLGLTAALARAGFFAHSDHVPPPLLVLLLPALALPLLLGLSRVGSALSQAPLAFLVGWQSFRLPLELVMHRAAREGTMPLQMSYGGANFDILTGATAVLVAVLAARGLAPRWLLLGWNALGSLLLVAILAIAVASLPAIAAFGQEPARLNTWIAYFPFVWLPAGLVSAAVLGHVLLWRRLLSRGMRGRALESLS